MKYGTRNFNTRNSERLRKITEYVEPGKRQEFLKKFRGWQVSFPKSAIIACPPKYLIISRHLETLTSKPHMIDCRIIAKKYDVTERYVKSLYRQLPKEVRDGIEKSAEVPEK